MKVVMVEPGQYARIEEMNTGLESLQKAVGGLIDCAYPWKDMACVVSVSYTHLTLPTKA